MLHQSWRACAFLHWAYDPAAVRRLIPPSLELETFDGRAWVSLISFAIPRMHPDGLPPIPGLAEGTESHLRTYVSGPDGRRGIWFLSLDIDPLGAALIGRVPFALPYWWASMEITRAGETVRYRVRRRFPGRGHLDLLVRPGKRIPAARERTLDHFLTARWVLYSGIGGLRASMLSEHPRWPLRRVGIEALEQTVTEVSGLPPTGAPEVTHFSDGVDARLSWPSLLLAR